MNLSKLTILLITMLFSLNLTAANLDYIIDKTRCKPSEVGSPILYGNDFKWGLSREEMVAKYHKLYNSKKRLQHHAYYDDSNDVFLIKNDFTDNDIELSTRFIKSIALHFEKALTNRYAEVPIFSDMGHNHFYIPLDLWETKYSKLSDDRDLVYEEFFKEEKLVMLYHTAEQLKMIDKEKKLLDDTYSQRRYFTRNIYGDNSMTGKMDMTFSALDEFNTVRSIHGYRLWSAGVYLSANKNGCFAFKLKDKLIYFDIGLHSLPYQNLSYK